MRVLSTGQMSFIYDSRGANGVLFSSKWHVTFDGYTRGYARDLLNFFSFLSDGWLENIDTPLQQQLQQ